MLMMKYNKIPIFSPYCCYNSQLQIRLQRCHGIKSYFTPDDKLLRAKRRFHSVSIVAVFHSLNINKTTPINFYHTEPIHRHKDDLQEPFINGIAYDISR